MQYHIGNDLPEEFIRYMTDFNRLYHIVSDAINGIDQYLYEGNYLYQLVSEMDVTTTIEDADIVQELSVIWLKAIKNYKKSKPNCNIRQYLIRMSVWGLRDWLQRESNIQMTAPIEEQEEQEEQPFTLDLPFLLYGSIYQPLQALTDYERYLIYLKYVDGKHIFEIAEHLQKDRSIVSKQLYAIHDKLRSQLNENAS